jgi:hypothetical protein
MVTNARCQRSFPLEGHFFIRVILYRGIEEGFREFPFRARITGKLDSSLIGTPSDGFISGDSFSFLFIKIQSLKSREGNPIPIEKIVISDGIFLEIFLERKAMVRF